MTRGDQLLVLVRQAAAAHYQAASEAERAETGDNLAAAWQVLDGYLSAAGTIPEAWDAKHP